MHKYRHFVDLPFSPDGTALEDPPSPNVQTQIALFRKALSSELVTDDVTSYDLAWLNHLTRVRFKSRSGGKTAELDAN
jgi:hypothetical protein